MRFHYVCNILVIDTTIGGKWDCFHMLTIVTGAALTSSIQSPRASFSSASDSRIAGSYGNFIFGFL